MFTANPDDLFIDSNVSGHYKFRVRMPYGQYRAWGLLDDLFSRMSEEHILKACAAMRADNDKINLLVTGELDNLVERDSMQYIGVAVHLGRNDDAHHLFKLVGGILLELEIKLGQDGRAQGIF